MRARVKSKPEKLIEYYFFIRKIIKFFFYHTSNKTLHSIATYTIYSMPIGITMIYYLMSETVFIDLEPEVVLKVSAERKNYWFYYEVFFNFYSFIFVCTFFRIKSSRTTFN